MSRPQSDSRAADSYTCPTGGVRYYVQTYTRASGTDATIPRDSNSLAAITLEPGSQAQEYEYIDVNEESED